MCSVLVCVGILFVLYKIIDYLIRLPRIGNYRDRYILVTGCDSGFGRLAAKRLDRLGCHVFAGCLTEEGAEQLSQVCSERLHTILLDVTKKESVRNALKYVKEKLPEDRGLWGLLNNAGVLINTGPPDWLTVEDYREQCDVNLWGLIDVTLTFLSLVKREHGRIVNTASIAGRASVSKFLPYSISKYGVEAFTDGIRRSVYYFGCKTSIIEPGGFKTGILAIEKFKVTHAKTWANAHPEVREEYGQEYAEYVIEKEFEKIVSLSSNRFDYVVDAYEHALFAVFPRERYVVGWDARFFYLPIHALPEWMGDWILRKIESARPLPAKGRR